MAPSSSSRLLISHSPDLKRLEDEGYELEIRAGHLLVHHVPYVTAERRITYGILVSTLDLAGDRTVKPSNHVVMFKGEAPCREDGTAIGTIEHADNETEAFAGFMVDRHFSSKPSGGYSDYYEKMTTYANILAGPAQVIDPAVTAKTFAVVPSDNEESPFYYEDTASTRAGIRAVTDKLRLKAVAIVGLGGTGSYILDLIAKTPIQEIHLFDGDRFGQHNAFRAPGAPSIETLREPTSKAEYFKAIYSRMHHNVVAHDHLDESSIELLTGMAFAFVAVDRNDSRRMVTSALATANVPFIDAGMGVFEVDGSLSGQLRVTTNAPLVDEHLQGHVPISDHNGDDEYSRNIQIADLNALNAALAVVRWKRLVGFYQDGAKERSSVYQIDGNRSINEARA